jgi:Domain of unknown function (DUF1989)
MLTQHETDLGSVVRRRSNQGPPEKGSWNVFFTLIDGSIPNTNPSVRFAPDSPLEGTEGPQVGDLDLWNSHDLTERFYSGKTRGSARDTPKHW